MANLIRHILGQRSFYPIFPPPEAHAAEVNLDVTHQELLRLDEAAPDILILPSKLKHFAKVVDSTLVVNPAFLSRAHSGGMYAKVIVHPMAKDKLQQGMDVDDTGEDLREHEISDRARAEIWRV